MTSNGSCDRTPHPLPCMRAGFISALRPLNRCSTFSSSTTRVRRRRMPCEAEPERRSSCQEPGQAPSGSNKRKLGARYDATGASKGGGRGVAKDRRGSPFRFVSFRFVSFLSNRCHRHGQFKVKFAFIPRTSSRTALACAQIKPDLKDVRASSGILPLSFPFDSKPCGPPTPRFQWNDWLHHPSPGQALRRPASCRVY